MLTKLSAKANESSLLRPRGWLNSSSRRAIGFKNMWALVVSVTVAEGQAHFITSYNEISNREGELQ